MVKEFEQQNEQDLAILIDPWLPRTKVAAEQREAMEQAISFAATVCLETCRRQGRRLVLGWTGATPGVCQGPASVKLLHELLEQLAVMRPRPRGPRRAARRPAAHRRCATRSWSSSRPGRSTWSRRPSDRRGWPAASARSLLGRAIVLNAAQGELADLIQYAGSSSRNLLEQRLSSADQERLHQPGRAPAASCPPTRTSPTGRRESRRRPSTERPDREQLSRLPGQLLSDAHRGHDDPLRRRHRLAARLASAGRWSPPRASSPSSRSTRRRGWGLPRELANVLALGTLGLLYLEYQVDETQLIRCLGHWLVYLQLIKYFLPKTAQDDWIPVPARLMQVLIGAVINQGDRSASGSSSGRCWPSGCSACSSSSARRAGSHPDAKCGRRYVASGRRTTPIAGCSISRYLAASAPRAGAHAAARRLLLPVAAPSGRRDAVARLRAPMAKHLTGFDEEVKLGQLGEILENDSVVMSVEFTDERRQARSSPPASRSGGA